MTKLATRNEEKTDQERFIELRAQGWSYDRIAKELGKAKQTIFNWKGELEGEVQNAKAAYLETLREEYWLTKQAKIELFGGLVKRIHEELEERDLSEVPTDKLMDMLNKLYMSLEKEAGTTEETYTIREIEQKREKRTMNEMMLF